RHARQRGQGRALPDALRRARAATGSGLPLRDRLVLPAEEEVDEGAAVGRSRARLVPDLPPLPLPARLLSREAASTARGSRGAGARAIDLGRGAERAATARARCAGAGPVPSLARLPGPR